MRLSTQIYLILGLCLVPATLMQLWSGWREYSTRLDQVGDLASQQAVLLAGDLDSIAEGVRILLSTASKASQVRRVGPDCDARMAEMANDAPAVRFILKLDGTGRIACVSDAALRGSGDEPWIVAAGSVQGFTAGTFTRAAGSKAAFLPFYMRLPATEAGPGGMMVVALDLDWLARHLAGLKHPGSPFLNGSVLTVADRNGVILARDVQNEAFAGRGFPPEAAALLTATRPGILRLKSMDGTFRTVGFTPPLPQAHALAAVAGFAEAEVTADVKAALLRNAALTLLIALLVFALTARVAHRFIATPTHDLLAAAHRWRDGDLGARVAWPQQEPAHQPQRGSEFAQLATAFNAMAERLQQREDELKRHVAMQEAEITSRTQKLVEANARLTTEIAEHRNTSAALLQAQKVQAMGRLAGGLAHDINNVLQAIGSAAALVRRRASEPTSVVRLIRLIEDATERGSSITRRLLAFAHRGELRAEPLDLREVLDGLREMLAPTLGPALPIALSVAPELPHILADRGQLETVVVNLVTNARDAMPAGGSVRITASVDPSPRPDGAAPPAYVRLEIADEGEGMDGATLQRATEPFFTTKPLGKGTGLGLTMARSFAEGSGGRFELDSTPGKGTRAVLWLPASPERLPAAQRPERRGPACAPRAILLVDDEPMLREVLGEQLREDGFHVTEADCGEAALEILSRGGRFDALISDLSMPGMDGMALIRQAQDRRPGLAAILLTGYAGNAEALAVHGATGCTFAVVRKPVTWQVLSDQLAIALGGSQGAMTTESV